MAVTPKRHHFDAKTKTEICISIFNKKLKFDDALEKYGLQPYQLYSWLGQYALSQRLSDAGSVQSKQVLEDDLSHTQTLTPADKAIPPDLARQVGEWVLANRKL